MRAVFRPVHGNDRLFCCSIETAEAVKVLYNTFISMKIAWANHGHGAVPQDRRGLR